MKLSLIDAHHHFQDLARFDYPWLMDRSRPPPLEGDLEPIRRSYLPDDYALDTAGTDILATVHVENGWNRRDSVGETRWLQSLAAKAPRLGAIVAYADLAAPDVEAILEAHLTASPLVRGIRQVLNWHETPALRVATSPGLMEEPRWREGFRLLRRHGLSFDLQLYWPQMEQAFTLAKTFPDTPIVLNHLGMPIDRTPEALQTWRAALRRLAAAPNLCVKLSGFGLGAPNWHRTAVLPLLETALSAFGARRCMVGTNLPVDSLFARPAAIFDTIGAFVAPLSETEREAVLIGTAMRVYRIRPTLD